jgi:hypothetical protein
VYSGALRSRVGHPAVAGMGHGARNGGGPLDRGKGAVDQRPSWSRVRRVSVSYSKKSAGFFSIVFGNPYRFDGIVWENAGWVVTHQNAAWKGRFIKAGGGIMNSVVCMPQSVGKCSGG